MKRQHLFLAGLGLMASAFAFQACTDDDDDRYLYPNALVTVKPNADNSQFFMQLDDNTTLIPVNMKSSPFGRKEVRALVNYSKSSQESGHYSQAVTVNWIDSILTKPLAQHLEAEQDIKTYGNDPVEIVNDWVTIAEDGYLTLRFRTRWGNGVRHRVNLVYRADADTPYLVTFHHDAHGDLYGWAKDGLVAFRLEGLPDTEGKTVDLTLQWYSYSGVKSAKFKYCTRKATPATAQTYERATTTHFD